MRTILTSKRYLTFLQDQLKIEKIRQKEQTIKEIMPDSSFTPSKMPLVTIVHATQSNTSKRFSDSLVDEAKLLKVEVQAKNVSELTLEDFKSNSYMLFLLSTYGEGGPTDDNIEFDSFLSANKADFSVKSVGPVAYSMFGLGSSKYEKFNAVAKKFDSLFKKAGYKQISTFGEGDDAENIQKDFDSWKKSIWVEIFNFFKSEPEEFKAKILKSAEFAQNLKPDFSYHVESDFDKEETKFKYSFRLNQFLSSSVQECVHSSELRQSTVNGSTLLLRLTAESYKLVDNVGIFPENRVSVVEEVAKILNFDLDKVFKVKANKPKSKLKLLHNKSIRFILTTQVDLNCHVDRGLLRTLAKHCSDEVQFEEIQRILKNEKAFELYSKKNFNFLDFIREFDSFSMDFIDFYQNMPKIAPRYYTLASSFNSNPGFMDVAASLLSWSSKNQEKRFGLVSLFFKDIHEGNREKKVRCFVKDSMFRLPSVERPLVCVATGTGIAPFIAFLQEIRDKKLKNKVHLYFGSKNKEFDYIFKSDLESFSKDIISLREAFSRDKKTKYYVQDALREDRDLVKELIIKQEAHIYLCGNTSMGIGIKDVLNEIFSSKDEKKVLDKLESEERLLKELWG